MNPRHLYLHVPFCDGACRYCGFYSVVNPSGHAAFALLPARELALRTVGASPLSPLTLYIGGGTPTALGASLDRLLDGLTAALDCQYLEECTLEATPRHVNQAAAARWRARGVTRVSLGVQSFDDTVLRAMGRRHDAADVQRAVRALRQAGGLALSLDLIAGWPGVSPSDWRRAIESALALAPGHLSIYALSLEPNSDLAAEAARGAWPAPDPEALMDALSAVQAQLEAAGYARYEISNYALPGQACRHNLAVWRGEDYLGLGPSAASRQGLLRRLNAADLDGYARALDSGVEPPGSRERLSEPDDRAERFITGLRLAEGVDPDRFAVSGDLSARHQVEQWRRVLRELEGVGLTARGGCGWKLTDRGREVADGVMRVLV